MLCVSGAAKAAGKNGWEQLAGTGAWVYYKDGVRLRGYQKIGESYYYFLEDSRAFMLTNNWAKIDGNRRYFGKDGRMVKGWISWRGDWYYTNNKGNRVTGWVKDGDRWYYMNSEGRMYKGWLKVGKDWYYLNYDGAMLVNGTLTQGNKAYKFDKAGKLI